MDVPISLDILRCQQALVPLEFHDGVLRSPAGLAYPVHRGLVFMGYDEREHSLMERVLAFEKAHQTSPELVERDLTFLRESSLEVLDLLDLLERRAPMAPGARGVELGAGSGWVSWLFAEAGFEMSLCELEPNSLYLGTLYEHERIRPGHRIVCDASYPPFADDTFDLVLCKEFAHHLRHYERLFREANRILRPGGRLLLYEPTKSITGVVDRWRHGDPVPEHHFVWPRTYIAALERAGFRVRVRGALRVRQARRIPVTAWANRTSATSARRDRSAVDHVTAAFLRIVGGQFVVLAEKVAATQRIARPLIRTVDPAALTATPADRRTYEPFRQLLFERSGRSTYQA